MKRDRSHTTWLFLLCAAAGGCHDYGRIYVDRPEVFTRERLINQRFSETSWLEKKLSEKYTHSYQGLVDYRQFHGTIASLTGTFDPLGGQLAALEATARIDDKRREGEIDELEHRRDKLKLLKEIEELEAAEAGGAANSGDSQDQGGDGGEKGSEPSQEAKKPQSEESTPEPDNEAEKRAKAMLEAMAQPSSLPNPGGLVTSTAEATALEKLRDEKAYREAIHAMLNETELDDTHDVGGQTLYTLKFDVTVAPEKTNRMMGMVRLEVETQGNTPDEWKKVYHAWRAKLQEDMNIEALDLQTRNRRSQMRRAERLALARLTHRPYKRQEQDAKKLKEQRETAKEDRDTIEKLVCQAHALLRPRQEDGNTQDFTNQEGNLDALTQGVHNTSLKNQAELYLKKVQAARSKRAGLLPGRVGVDDELKEKGSTLEKLADEKHTKALKQEALGQRVLEALDAIADGEVPDEDPDGADNYALCLLIMERYNTLEFRKARGKACAVEGYIDFAEPSRWESTGGKVTYGINFKDANDAQINSFICDMNQLVGDTPAYVYTVGPKEQAQNISSVVALDRLRSLILSVKAALPQSGIKDASAYLEDVKRSETRIQGILRKPLAVGFIDGEKEFGWLLGPRFEPTRSGKGYRFSHVPVQHSVQATIVAPAWATKVRISGSWQWVDEDDLLPPYVRSDCKDNDCTDFTALLPGDCSTITNALLEFHGHASRVPRITQLPEQGTPIHLREGRNDFVIHGKNLWRNPTVFVGEQKADDFKVLPNMEGLYVTIEKVAMPPGTGRVDVNLPLTVVTSYGVDVLPDAFTLHSQTPQKGDTTRPAPFLRLFSRYAVAGNHLVYATIPDKVPAGFHDIRLVIHLVGSSWQSETIIITDQEDPQLNTQPPLSEVGWKLSVTDTNKVPEWWKKGPHELVAKVQIQRFKDGGWADVSTTGRNTFVYFPNEASMKPKVTSEEITFDPNETNMALVVKLPASVDLLDRAWPGLGEALGSSNLEIEIEDSKDPSRKLTLPCNSELEGDRSRLVVASETLNERFGVIIGDHKSPREFTISQLTPDRGKDYPAIKALDFKGATVTFKKTDKK